MQQLLFIHLVCKLYCVRFLLYIINEESHSNRIKHIFLPKISKTLIFGSGL